MGGHWGPSSGSSDRRTVRASAVVDALENWTYSTRPSDRDAVVRRLSAAFPAATARRGDASTAYDVRVDDIRIVIANGLDSAFRRDFHAVADRFDDVVVYSTTCHTSTPNEWREFKHRHRRCHAGARVRFAHRREPTANDGSRAVGTPGKLALSIVGIVGLLAGSLGAFELGGIEVHAQTVGFVVALVLGAVVASLLARRRFAASLLRRIPHT